MTVLRRRLWVPLLAVGLLALVLLALYVRAVIPSFGTPRPSNLVRPELVGVIEAVERSGAVLQLSFDGHELELDTGRSTHLFGPAVNDGVLLLYGEPEEAPLGVPRRGLWLGPVVLPVAL